MTDTAQGVRGALRRELGGFLRAHRELLAPADVGLPRTPRRRTSGLRREEVAALSGVSVAWYTWLEQGRVDTSRQVLDAVARALRMDGAAREHALALAGFAPEGPGGPNGLGGPDASDALATPHAVAVNHQHLLDSWPTSPALLLGPALDLLAWNTAYATLWPDPAAVPADRRNLLLLLTGDPHHQRLLPAWQPLAMDLYRHFRTRADRAPLSARFGQLTARLRAERPDLEEWWDCRSVGEFAPRTMELAFSDGQLARYGVTLLLTPEPRGGAVLVQTPAH
ncbi:helix-turn-helix domain-containing protein [Streptomyces flavofungini]|uniref:Helix-turn-helix domain-containing protein n=1 Tax=Streptomyces flavofungini TaxID=68200 RepID=A0ABS0X0M0_9ACTN|nr:helix-turn-helix domain-containing protein [Streptomyces flavofungini]MBJ3806693.1 helix-turn-helix domain-containing protein [Streptomyces flavofungini]GHC61183.1 putative DNA-binding protein [Streptomyces flavofungini]